MSEAHVGPQNSRYNSTDVVILSDEKDDETVQWPRSYRAYLVLLSGFLMQFNCWGLIMAFGAFLGFYDVYLLHNTSKQMISLIGGTQAFFVLALAPIMGRLLDAHYQYYIGFSGFFLISVGYIGLSFTSGQGLANQGTYWAIWLTTAVAGLGQACFFVYSSQNVAQWFPNKKFTVIGITSGGAAIGGLVYPIAFKNLVANYGFPSGVRIFASIAGSTSFLAFIFGSPHPHTARRPLGPIFNPATWIDVHAFRTAAYNWYAASLFFIFLGFYVLPFYVTLWAANKDLGTDEDTESGTGELRGSSGFRSFWFLSIMNACGFIGRMGSGYIAGRWSSLHPILVHAASCFAAAITALLWWPLIPHASTGSAIAFCAVFGMLGGAIVGLPPSGVARIIPKGRATCLGQWTGMAFLIAAPPGLVGPTIGGFLEKRFGENSIGLFGGAGLLAAAGCQVVTWWVMVEDEVGGEDEGEARREEVEVDDASVEEEGAEKGDQRRDSGRG